MHIVLTSLSSGGDWLHGVTECGRIYFGFGREKKMLTRRDFNCKTGRFVVFTVLYSIKQLCHFILR